MINELDENNFTENISQGLKLVEFYAVWCGYCRKQQEILKEMDKIWIGQVNADNCPALAKKYNVSGFPTFLVFNDGIEVERFSGLHSKFDIMNILNKYIINNMQHTLDIEADEDF